VLHFAVDAGARGADEGVEIQHHVLVAAAGAVEARTVLRPLLAFLEDALILFLPGAKGEEGQ
jgi:hypothetical protein